MNLLLLGMLIFVLIYILLNWLTKNSSKTIANTTRKITLISSFVLAIILTFAGKFIFSLPMALLFLNALKIKGLSTFQIFQLWRLISYLRSTGRFSYTSSQNTRSSSNITIEESYKILGLNKGCKKEEVIKATVRLQKKIHPDMNTDINTERLSQLVNEARDKILNTDFS